MRLEERVRELAEEKIAGTDLFVVDVRMLPRNRLLVLLDGDRGVSIDQCAAISRHIGSNLEEEDAVGHAYTLEVSSPGLDTPLKLLRQYRKNIGRDLAVKMQDGTKRRGKLLVVNEDRIRIEEKVKVKTPETRGKKNKKTTLTESEIFFSDMDEATVVISF